MPDTHNNLTLEEKSKFIDNVLKQYRSAFKEDSLTLWQVYKKVNKLVAENKELNERLKKLQSAGFC